MNRKKNTFYMPGRQDILGEALTLPQLAQRCDDLQRDPVRGVKVLRAVLAHVPGEGFYLSVEDDQFAHVILDEQGVQMRFLSIQTALFVLRSIEGLQAEIALFDARASDITHWSIC